MWMGLREGHDELEVAPGWTVIEPPGRFPGPIERIAIGIGGILAVARWSGDVTVVDGVLHQGGRRRELQAADLVRDHRPGRDPAAQGAPCGPGAGGGRARRRRAR